MPVEDRPRSSRRPPSALPAASRKLWLLGALSAIAFVGGGCSQTPTGGGVTSGTSGGGVSGGPTGLERAVQFAKCMRSNGVGNFPDPGPSGQFTIDAIANGSGVNTNTPAFTQAMSACRSLEPPGFTGAPRTAQQQNAALEFAQCVRDNGVTDFPDPTPGGPLIDTNRVPSAATPAGMDVLHAAMRKCARFSTAAGVAGAR